MKIKGFTLIELLVVIAVIGILMGITITQIGGARARGYNAQIQAIVSDAMVAAESKYIDDGVYPGQGGLPTFIIPPCSYSTESGCHNDGPGPLEDQTTDKPAVSRSADNQKIAIALRLCGVGNVCWCADSRGIRKRITTAPSGGECP